MTPLQQNTEQVTNFNHPVECMQFRLVYNGPLLTTSNSSRRGLQQNIRKEIHSQLETLFRVHPGLSGYIAYEKEHSLVQTVETGNFVFFPLVRDKLWMTCHLDILLLVRAKPMGLITHGGDIDNRIKVFIDALRIPSRDELPPNAVPTEKEKPFYCLLEDDKLITGFSVRADRLLALPHTDEKDSDVRLVIDVSVKLSRMSWANIDFVSD